MIQEEESFEDWADSVLYPKKKKTTAFAQAPISRLLPPLPPPPTPNIPQLIVPPKPTGLVETIGNYASKIPGVKPLGEAIYKGLGESLQREATPEQEPAHSLDKKLFDTTLALYRFMEKPGLKTGLGTIASSPALEIVSRPYGAVQEAMAKTPEGESKLGAIYRRVNPEVVGEQTRETPQAIESLQNKFPFLREHWITAGSLATLIDVFADPVNFIPMGAGVKASQKLSRTNMIDHLVNTFKITPAEAMGWVDNKIVPSKAKVSFIKEVERTLEKIRPSEAGMARIRKGVPEYLNEVVDYGGIPTKKGDIIKDLQRQGSTQKEIDRYMQGMELSQGKITPEGKPPIPEMPKVKFYQIETNNKFLPSKKTSIFREYEMPDGTKYVAKKTGNDWTSTKWKSLNEAIPELQKTENIVTVKEWDTTPTGRVIVKPAKIEDIVTPPSTTPIKGVKTPKPSITAPEQGIGQIPPEKPPVSPMPSGVSPEDEFYNLLKAGRLNEAEAQLPKIDKHLDRATAMEYLEEAKIRATEAEKYFEQFPVAGEGKSKPEMASYEDLYPPKYEVDIGKEIELKKLTELRSKTLALIESKELSNDTMARIRTGLNIGSVKKASVEQLDELYTFVNRLEKGDKFLSPKQSEALKGILQDIERPELTPKRIIIDKFGDKEEILSKGVVGKIPNQLLPTVDIKEGHPLITRIVNKADDLLWEAENETARRLTKFDEMLNVAEKSRPGRGIKEKLLKTNPEIFDALSGKQVDLTKEEAGVVAYLRNFFAKARKDLELDKFRKNYVTHIEQGLEEKIWNQGIKKTVSEMIGKRPQDPNIPMEIMSALDDIIGSEKFFKYSQKRTGALTPTQNLRKIMQEYSTVYERVMALNKVLPEGQAVQQVLLQPKSAMWMKRYLQNLKGRALDFEFRNGKAAWLANVGDKIVDIGYLKLLGGNYWSALKNIVAGEANSFITTPLKSYLTGKARFMLSPKKALKMAKEYGILNDMFYEYASTGFKGGVRKLERVSMIGQAIGESEIRTSLMLSQLTPEEWSRGVISMARRRQILDHVAQTQGIFSKTQSPLLLQTAPGRMIFQMNRWRITNGLLVRRITNSAVNDMRLGLVNTQNTRNFAKMFMLYGTGMYLAYELAKEGYNQAAKVAQSMAETVNNMVELATTDTIVKMFRDNPSFSVLNELTYTIQELAAYIGVPGIQEPRKISFRKGIEDTYIAPYERTMELLGENDDVTGAKSDEFERMFEKEFGVGNPESEFEKAMGIK